MGGSLIVKRDPVTLGLVVSALITMLGSAMDWSPILIASLVGLVTAVVGVVQAKNVFGTDKFTAYALNFVGAAFALATALSWNLSDGIQNAITVGIPILLGLFARNGVTNRFAPDGSLTQVPTATALDETPGPAMAEPGPFPPTTTSLYGGDSKYEAALGHGALSEPPDNAP